MTWTAADLKKTPISERIQQLPHFLIPLIQAAIQELNPERIWLFGSRARGDARTTSDFDLAFKIHPTRRQQEWTTFYTAQTETPPSLHKYDLIDYDLAGEELKQKIVEEGVLLYEQTA